MLFTFEHNVCRFSCLRMWAERGLIHIEDTTDGDYNVVAVRAMLERMQAIQEMLINSRRREKNSEDKFTANVVEAQQRMLEQMANVVRQAQEQGMPSDPTARGTLQRQRKTVMLPASYCQM